MPAKRLQYVIDSDADAAVRGLDKSAKAVEKAGRAADKASTRIDRAADAGDGLGEKTGKATGALGALASGFELVGLEAYAEGLEKAALGTDFLSGVGDSMNLVLGDTAKKLATAAKGSKVAAAATKVMAAAQRVLNSVLRANPIGLVITVIALLATGLVLAYKKSETFRRITKGAFGAIQKAGRFMWNNVLQPVFQAFIRAVAKLAESYAFMFEQLGKVPGFGWATAAAEKLRGAADKANNLADNINKIPRRVNVDVVVKASVTGAEVGSIIGNLRTAPAASGRGFATPAAGGRSQVVNITVNGALDSVAVARQIQQLLRTRGALVSGNIA